MPRVAPLFCVIVLPVVCFPQAVSRAEPAIKVEVRSLVFDDTVGLPDQVARDAQRGVTRRTYGPDFRTVVPEVVRDAFQRDGYFKATVLAPLRFTIVGNHKGKLEVDAHVIAISGERYDLASRNTRARTPAIPCTNFSATCTPAKVPWSRKSKSSRTTPITC